MTDSSNRITVEQVSEGRWAARAADLTVVELKNAIRKRGVATLAISGGSTPAPYFEALAKRTLAWDRVVIVQVDERLAEEGSPERNLTKQKSILGRLGAVWLLLPVEHAGEPDHLRAFVVALRDVAGDPPVLDVVHLGLGADGHTASLLVGDPVLEESHHVIALTQEFQGTARLTITAPTLSRARLVLWLVRGTGKQEPIRRLLEADPTIPASLITARRSALITEA